MAMMSIMHLHIIFVIQNGNLKNRHIYLCELFCLEGLCTLAQGGHSGCCGPRTGVHAQTPRCFRPPPVSATLAVSSSSLSSYATWTCLYSLQHTHAHTRTQSLLAISWTSLITLERMIGDIINSALQQNLVCNL